jgi:hypothetical protein
VCSSDLQRRSALFAEGGQAHDERIARGASGRSNHPGHQLDHDRTERRSDTHARPSAGRGAELLVHPVEMESITR